MLRPHCERDVRVPSLYKFGGTPWADDPEVGIDGVAAGVANFREGRQVPSVFGFPATPRAVFHEVGHLAAAMVAFGFVIGSDAVGFLRDKAWTVAPRAIVPVRGNAAVAVVADMGQL